MKVAANSVLHKLCPTPPHATMIDPELGDPEPPVEQGVNIAECLETSYPLFSQQHLTTWHSTGRPSHIHLFTP